MYHVLVVSVIVATTSACAYPPHAPLPDRTFQTSLNGERLEIYDGTSTTCIVSDFHEFGESYGYQCKRRLPSETSSRDGTCIFKHELESDGDVLSVRWIADGNDASDTTGDIVTIKAGGNLYGDELEIQDVDGLKYVRSKGEGSVIPNPGDADWCAGTASGVQ